MSRWYKHVSDSLQLLLHLLLSQRDLFIIRKWLQVRCCVSQQNGFKFSVVLHQKHGDEGFTIVPYRLICNYFKSFHFHNGGYTFLIPSITAGILIVCVCDKYPPDLFFLMEGFDACNVKRIDVPVFSVATEAPVRQERRHFDITYISSDLQK